MHTRKTPLAARELGITYSHLIRLLRNDRLAPPGRDSSGDYLWSDNDLERVRQVLAKGRRRAKAAK
jgi:hypothetical protein